MLFKVTFTVYILSLTTSLWLSFIKIKCTVSWIMQYDEWWYILYISWCTWFIFTRIESKYIHISCTTLVMIFKIRTVIFVSFLVIFPIILKLIWKTLVSNKWTLRPRESVLTGIAYVKVRSPCIMYTLV